jgi:hypothetical protein
MEFAISQHKLERTCARYICVFLDDVSRIKKLNNSFARIPLRSVLAKLGAFQNECRANIRRKQERPELALAGWPIHYAWCPSFASVLWTLTWDRGGGAVAPATWVHHSIAFCAIEWGSRCRPVICGLHDPARPVRTEGRPADPHSTCSPNHTQPVTTDLAPVPLTKQN